MRAAPTPYTLHVKIHSPFVVYFDGDALSVSAVNETGPFDILPEHYKMLTLLSACDIIVRLVDGAVKTIPVKGGVMHVKHDRTTVFLDV